MHSRWLDRPHPGPRLLDGWYPYPFLNPVNGGYGTVAVTVVAVTIGFALIAAATIALGNSRSPANGGDGRPRPLAGLDARGLLDSSTRELEAARTHGARARSSESEVRAGRVGFGRALTLLAFLPIASRVPMYSRLITSLVMDERMPMQRKALLAGAAGYLVLGRDLIPDDWPIIGGLDDLVVVVLAAELFLDGVPDDLLNEKLADLGIDRAEFDRDVAQVRRLTPGRCGGPSAGSPSSSAGSAKQ